MAYHVEPMDIDSTLCDFDDKENSFHHNNVLPRTPCTEKGYEELDVSELNMKLRYSITPVASPMSKSYTANSHNNQYNETDTLDFENGNMTRSLNSTLPINDTIMKTQKSLPLKIMLTDNSQIGDGNRIVLQPLDSTTTADNITVTVTEPNDIVDNLSLPSSSSSMAHTPEATTPTKEIQKDGGSPIMRGLKSVLSMFRPSQSPIPLDNEQLKEEAFSPPIVHSPEGSDKAQAASASTPLTGQKTKDPLAKRNSPSRDNLVFNEDLEKELEWKDDSILFGNEKIPIHKLFFQPPNQSASKTNPNLTKTLNKSEKPSESMNETLEYMDISYYDSGIMDKIASFIPDEDPSEEAATESDGEFLDAETTIKSESQFEQSLKSQETNLRSIQEGNNLHEVQQENLNITTETLNYSISSSGDITSVSTETTKEVETSVEKSAVMEEVSAEPGTVQVEKNVKEIISVEIGKLDSIHSADIVASLKTYVSNNYTNTIVVEPVSAFDNIVKSSVDNMNVNIINNNIEAGLSPVTDNVVVCSIPQIPLIVDPRVSSGPKNFEQDNNAHESHTVDALSTSPADVPLPDDDDMASLPSINCALDNISQVLDKISQEIPKINQRAVEQEILQSASKEGKLLDLTLSNLTASDGQESSTSKKVEISLLMEESVVSPVVLENKVEETPATEPVSQPIKVAEEPTPEPNVKLDETQAIITAIEELIPARTAIEQESSLAPQYVELMEISTAEAPSAYQSKMDNEHVANENACFSKAVDMPIEKEIDNKLKEVQEEKNTIDEVLANDALSNEINKVINKPLTQHIPCALKVSFLLKDEAHSIAALEKPGPQLIESNIEFIKHEVEAIIDKAVDTVMEKFNASEHEIKVKEHVNTIENNQVQCCEDTIKTFETDLYVSTGLLSDTVTNVITAATHNAARADAGEITGIQTTNIQDNNMNVDINTTPDLTQSSVAPAVTNAVDYIGIAGITFEEPILKEATSDNIPLLDAKVSQIMDITPPDMEKIEKKMVDDEIQIITDKNVVVSETNSPFMLVCQNQVIDSIALENFEVIENPFLAKSIVTASPPSSPAIVSKGYNFNFDEIEDPFATKAKIKMSPPPGESPNRTFEQTDNKNKDLPRKVNKNDRRKSPPERKKPISSNTKVNSTIARKIKTPDKSDSNPRPTVAETIESTALQFELKDEPTTEIIKSQIKDAPNDIVKEAEIASKEIPSFEQSAYFSAVTPSSEQVGPKNTVPDLEDLNPFATKSKIRQSPPRDGSDINPFASKTKICQTPPPALIEDSFATNGKIGSSTESSNAQDTETTAVNTTVLIDSVQETALSSNSELNMDETIEKESSEYLNFTTTSTTKNEKHHSFKTVNTEDEDTIEGPFLEAEEFNNEDKMSEFDGENVDMMQFPDVSTENETNTEAGEMFIDAEAFEFLLNQNQFNTVADCGKESLFLKFDPLFAKRASSDGVLPVLSRVQKKQSTPKKKERTLLPRDATFDKSPAPGSFTPNRTERPPLSKDATFDKSPGPGPSTPKRTERPQLSKDETFDKSHIPGPSNFNIIQEPVLHPDVHNTTNDSCDDLNVTVSKPMMVVNPAVNAVVTPRNKSLTPVRSNRQSFTFTSPAIAVIDRLLSMSSANNSFMNHDTTVAEVHRDNEADLALTQLRELLADKEISVYNLRTETKELQNRLATMESQMKTLEATGEQRLKKIDELNERLDGKIKLNKSMAKVVEEYERTIASLIAETEQDKLRHAEEREQLIRERNEQTAHLASMEISFNDLHSKYEKSKQVILGFKANEDLYKKSIKEFEENLIKMQKNYELLKQHATSKLNYANEELQKLNRSHESELLKLNAMIKRKEMHITSLEETLQQKTKANEELTAICDELINKVG